MLFKGSGVALVTPFNNRGEINYFELKNLIAFQIANNTKALIILGTTGEASTLSFEEREKVIKFTVAETNHKVPVIVGTGNNCTKTAIKFTDWQGNEVNVSKLSSVKPISKDFFCISKAFQQAQYWQLFYIMFHQEQGLIFCRKL